MDILKIIFEHDMTLEHLSGHDDPRNRKKARNTSTLEDFLQPQSTYNRYYFTGTQLPDQTFGLTRLAHFPEIRERLEYILEKSSAKSGWHGSRGNVFHKLSDGLHDIGQPDFLLSGTTSDDHLRNQLIRDHQTGIRERFKPLTRLLDNNHLVLMTEKAHHGMDLHLFSRQNLFENLFLTFQKIVQPRLRYFSINGKRVASERHFYFETWTLDRPPHGFQEVTPDARIR